MYSRVTFDLPKNKDLLYLQAIENNVVLSEIVGFLHGKDGTLFKDFYKKYQLKKNMTKNSFLENLRNEILSFMDHLPLKKSPLSSGQGESILPKNKPDSYLGELCCSQESNILECISLFLDFYDPIQSHNNLRNVGKKIISLVPQNTSFIIEEYFWRFLKLKLLINDGTIIIVAFNDIGTSKTPTFLSLDDEDLIRKLRSSVVTYLI